MDILLAFQGLCRGEKGGWMERRLAMRSHKLPLPPHRCGTPCQVIKRTLWVILCLGMATLTIPTAVTLGKMILLMIGESPWAPGTVVELLPAGQDPSMEGGSEEGFGPSALCNVSSVICTQLASVTVYLEVSDYNITDPLARCSERHACNETYQMGSTVWITNTPELGAQVIKDPGPGVLLVGSLGFILAVVWALLLCGLAVIYFFVAIIRGFCDPFPPATGPSEYSMQMSTMLSGEESIGDVDIDVPG